MDSKADSKTPPKQNAERPFTGRPFTRGDPRINRKGRPPKANTCSEYLVGELSKEDWAKHVCRLCRKGSIKALELYAAYIWGKPRQTFELEHSGYIDPIQIMTHEEREAYIAGMGWRHD